MGKRKELSGSAIEEDGYLRRELAAIVNDLAFTENISTTEDQLERILIKIQNFDPAGIGARNLQECLLLQLYKKDYGGNKSLDLAEDRGAFSSLLKDLGIPYPKFLVQTKAYADKNSFRVTNFPLNN